MGFPEARGPQVQKQGLPGCKAEAPSWHSLPGLEQVTALVCHEVSPQGHECQEASSFGDQF